MLQSKEKHHEPKLINDRERMILWFGYNNASCTIGESKIYWCNVGSLSMLSISAIFHNTNNANDIDCSLIKHPNFQFYIEIPGIPVLLEMLFSRRQIHLYKLIHFPFSKI